MQKVSHQTDQYKNGPGEMNFPGIFRRNRLSILVIIIVGDSDGLLAIRPDEHTAELAEIARKYHAGEEKQLEGILTRGEWPRPWVDETLKKVGFEFVD